MHLIKKVLLVLNFLIVTAIALFIPSLFHLNPFSSWSVAAKTAYILSALYLLWEVFGSTMVLLGTDSLFMKQFGKYKIPLHFPPLHWTNIPKRIRHLMWKTEQPWHKYLIGDYYEVGKSWNAYQVITITLALVGITWIISTF